MSIKLYIREWISVLLGIECVILRSMLLTQFICYEMPTRREDECAKEIVEFINIDPFFIDLNLEIGTHYPNVTLLNLCGVGT